MKLISSFLLFFASAVVCVPSVLAETLSLDEIKTPIRVDGHLNDWPESRMILLDKSSQVVYGKGYWRGPEDFSGRVFLAYDSRYLYLAVLVTKRDKVVNQQEKTSLWNGDCLELFFSSDSAEGGLRLSKGDYHIGFSPGSDCANPQMYCLNKARGIRGGRVIARATNRGYLMEAAVPLDFFAGLSLGPGKKSALNLALDGGGFSGNRVVQLDLSEQDSSWENPARWAEIQWTGKTELSIPQEEAPSLFTGSIQDGTKGSTLAGVRTLKGKVTNAEGSPLKGAVVTTWPRSLKAVTDANGEFEIGASKVYDKTVVYAMAEGYASSLAPIPTKGTQVLIRLWPMLGSSGGSLGSGSPTLFGQTLLDPLQEGALAGVPAKKNLSGVSRFGPVGMVGKPKETWAPALDKFVDNARSHGAEPLLEVPVGDPVFAAQWVAYCNVEKKYGVKYWALGNEPDLKDAGTTLAGRYDVGDYINEFRACNNAMKRVDPSIYLLGPELGTLGEGTMENWVVPFLEFNGDIVNLVSIHRYATLKAAGFSSRSLEDSLRQERSLLRGLKGMIAENSDLTLPLAVTGGWTCSEAVTGSGGAEAGDFNTFLWMAEEGVIAFQEGLALDLFSPKSGGGVVAGQAAWVLQLLSGMKGGFVEAHALAKPPGLFAYAAQDPATHDVTLLLLNKGDRYRRVRGRLDERPAEVTVSAKLDLEFDYEAPSFSISLLKIKADRSQGQARCYSRKMMEAGKEPESSPIKVW